MLRNAFIKDCIRQVRSTLSRFISILIITALGVAFFAGLRATGPDMRYTASQYYDQTNFMDIRLLSSLGFDEEDIAAVRQVQGIEDLQPAYSFDVIAVLPEESFTVRLHSLPEEGGDEINSLRLTEGRLPQNGVECVADPKFMKKTGLKVGDSVSFASGTSDPLSDTLTADTFTIVGVADSPLYITVARGSSTVGSGRLDAYFYIPASDFTLEVYTEVYLTVANPDGLSRFDDGFPDLLEPVVSALEDTGEGRAQLRYEKIVSDAREELDDAKAEVADGYKKLEDAQKELDDAKVKLDDGWKEYYDGQKKLEDETSAAQVKLEDARKTLDEEWQNYYDGQAEFNSQIVSAKKKLDDGSVKYESGLADYQSGLTKYQQGLAAYNKGRSDFNKNEETYKSGQESYNGAKALSDALTFSLAAGNDPQALQTLTALAVQVGAFNPQLGELLTAYVSSPEDPTLSEAAKGGAAQFAQSLVQTKSELDNAKIQLDAGRAQLDATGKQLSEAKAELDTGKAELDKAKKELDEGYAQLEASRIDGQRELDDGKAKLQDAEGEYSDGVKTLAEEKASGEAELEKAYKELTDGQSDYEEGLAELEKEKNDALVELRDAQDKIDDGERELADLKQPEWYVLDNETNAGFLGYKNDTERIDVLSLVIPILFFLVAVLVTMTSMTRLVDSDRSLIGTYKAMGYGGGAIASRYLLYAVAASLVGSVIGLVAGYNIFPSVVYNAYGSTLYTLPPLQLQFHLNYSVISIVIAVLCAALPAYLVCLQSLRESPAQLMRPASPKLGRRIFLERLSFIWKRMNFSQKVAARNLFRYKKRLIMTVIGVAGCTALMFTGFGLRDSVTTIVPKQYGSLQDYDLQLNLKQDLSDEDRAELDKAIADITQITSRTSLTAMSVDAISGITKAAYLMIPSSPEQFTEFITLRDRRTRDKVILDDGSVILTEKLASLLGVKKGDTFTLRDTDNKDVSVTVGGIAENYVGHYVYMSPVLYRELYGEDAEVNQLLIKLSDVSDEEHSRISEALMEQENVSSVSLVGDMKNVMDDTVNALDFVMVVLILSAAALLFVVLFSLTSINVEERRRELATIKVLGFFNNELAAYIYRENIILTLLGTIFGLGLGVVLQRYIITTMEIDMMMFSRDLLWQSYVFSAVLTFVFSAAVNALMYRHIVNINMASSLKSIE